MRTAMWLLCAWLLWAGLCANAADARSHRMTGEPAEVLPPGVYESPSTPFVDALEGLYESLNARLTRITTHKRVILEYVLWAILALIGLYLVNLASNLTYDYYRKRG